MFRKHYTDANNDIKPSEEFVNSVIENTHKGPPVKGLYVRYTAAAAAAVIMVSAALLSMPLWQNVTDNDGVIIAETMSPNTTDSPQSMPALSDENTVVNDNNANTSAADNNSDNVPVQDYNNSQKSAVSPAAAPKKNTVTENTKIQDTNETARETENIPTEESGQTEENAEIENRVFQDVQESTDTAELPPRTPPPSVSNAKKPVESNNYSFHDDPSLPSPDGYRCVSTSPNGYTFASEDGAVIVVEISYGSDEDSEPYYSADGDSIFASFSSYGMTVTVRSTGADMSTIEEIINTLR